MGDESKDKEGCRGIENGERPGKFKVFFGDIEVGGEDYYWNVVCIETERIVNVLLFRG